jgi:hypothetical protein
MARLCDKTVTGKIFENILFLAEVFGDNSDKDIPDVPVLELARCFELSQPRLKRPMVPLQVRGTFGNDPRELSNH